MKRGFSLTELLTTIVILAVLASIAIPNFSKSKEKAAAQQAVAYLRVIATAEKMYFAKNSVYECETAGECNTKAEILSKLGAEITTENYSFDVTGGANFSVSAARGACVITLSDTGVFTTTASCPVTAATLNA